MTKLMLQSIRQTVVWSVVTGIVYPLVITAIAQAGFKDKANGSLITRDGKIIGSALLAQQFQGTNYFWPRPSACTYGCSPGGLVASSGSNLGPTSAKLQAGVTNNAIAFITGNNLPTNAVVPVDMIFASASGLDPHISPEAAQLQVTRVAASRGVSEENIKMLVDRFTEPPQWGFLGQARVNVLRLNVALDELTPKAKALAVSHKNG
jgi:K+-transporting ATPase ATPase C chain